MQKLIWLEYAFHLSFDCMFVHFLSITEHLDIEQRGSIFVELLSSYCSLLVAKWEGVVFGPCFAEKKIESWLLYFVFLLSCGCYCFMSLLLGVVCWSMLRGCGISWSCVLTFYRLMLAEMLT